MRRESVCYIFMDMGAHRESKRNIHDKDIMILTKY